MARQRPRPATPANTRILAGAALLVLTVGLTACEDPDGGGGGGYVANTPSAQAADPESDIVSA